MQSTFKGENPSTYSIAEKIICILKVQFHEPLDFFRSIFFLFFQGLLKFLKKSDNLKYNTLDSRIDVGLHLLILDFFPSHTVLLESTQRLFRWLFITQDIRQDMCCIQCSIFFFITSYVCKELKTLYFHFCNFIKKIIGRVFAKNSARFYEKKIMLVTSDAWLTSCLSHRPSEPACHIVD